MSRKGDGVRLCPECGARFVCDHQAGRGDCWCTRYPALLHPREDAQCLCPECLKRAIERQLAGGEGEAP